MEQNVTLLEKYFPKSFDDLKLPTKIKNEILSLIKTKGYRILFHSSPGTGKTTTARLMCTADDDKHELMYLSGSNNFNIETMRAKIMPFSSGFSVLGKQKTIIIDEAENIRNDLQDSFKIILDQCKQVNFIFITNEIEKINTAVRSRTTSIDYNFINDSLEEQKKNFISFTLDVCKKENIKYEGPAIKILLKMFFPDFRHLLIILESIKSSNLDLTLENVKKFTETGKSNIELYNLIETPSINGKELYSELTKFKGKERECFESLGEPFFVYLNDKELYDRTLESAIIVSKYSDSFILSINKFVTLMSCIIELKSLFR